MTMQAESVSQRGARGFYSYCCHFCDCARGKWGKRRSNRSHYAVYDYAKRKQGGQCVDKRTRSSLAFRALHCVLSLIARRTNFLRRLRASFLFVFQFGKFSTPFARRCQDARDMLLYRAGVPKFVASSRLENQKS